MPTTDTVGVNLSQMVELQRTFEQKAAEVDQLVADVSRLVGTAGAPGRRPLAGSAGRPVPRRVGRRLRQEPPPARPGAARPVPLRRREPPALEPRAQRRRRLTHLRIPGLRRRASPLRTAPGTRAALVPLAAPRPARRATPPHRPASVPDALRPRWTRSPRRSARRRRRARSMPATAGTWRSSAASTPGRRSICRRSGRRSPWADGPGNVVLHRPPDRVTPSPVDGHRRPRASGSTDLGRAQRHAGSAGRPAAADTSRRADDVDPDRRRRPRGPERTGTPPAPCTARGRGASGPAVQPTAPVDARPGHPRPPAPRRRPSRDRRRRRAEPGSASPCCSGRSRSAPCWPCCSAR